MGQEVGWYLRLSRASRVEALVDPGLEASMRDQQATCPSWALDLRPQEGALCAVFSRSLGRERG